MTNTAISSGWTIQSGAYDPLNNIIGATANNNYGYVCGYNGDAVYVINPNTMSVIETISTGASSNATDCCITPDGRYVYATLYGAGTVVCINTSSNTIINTITTGTNPWDICISPDGRYVYNTNRGSDTVTVIDTVTNTVVKTLSLPTGAAPIQVALTPDGRRLFVGDTSSANCIYVYDTVTWQLLETLNTGFPNGAFGISPDGRYLVTNYDNGGTSQISIYNANSYSLIKNFTAYSSPHNICFAQNGQYCYIVSDGANTIYVLDLINLTVTTVTFGGGIGGGNIAITPDGLYVYTSWNATNNLFVMDTRTNKVVAQITETTDPNGICFMPRYSSQVSANYNMNSTRYLSSTGYATPSGTATSVTLGASPYTYTNTSLSNQELLITGGTISAISYAPNGGTGISMNIGLSAITLRVNDTLTITYTTAPTINTIQL